MTSNTFPDQFNNLPWGCQDNEYKKSMSLLKKAAADDNTFVFTYRNVPHSRIPSKDEYAKLWTAVPYEANNNKSSATMGALTEEKLQQYPGLKQHIPHITNDPNKTEEDKHSSYDDSSVQNKIAQNSCHRMSINSNITTKMGPGPKFFENGCNACINAI